VSNTADRMERTNRPPVQVRQAAARRRSAPAGAAGPRCGAPAAERRTNVDIPKIGA